ncbi:MAG: Gfo/Idh/MocA family oxidoreductase [Deltaproteobacteria bacterium]|nr:Gfo/Idh/MocA family oxidoreductase [Deltaproteobacteria bacterium]
MGAEIQAAVIGAGYWGTNLIRVLHNTDGMWLKAVCDARPEILQEVKARYPQVALTQSYEHILRNPNIAAVLLATPPATHYQLARAALAAGKHVWVEKPLALAYAEGRELVALARDRQRLLFVDETFLYDPLVQQARAIIMTGVLGKIYHVSSERTGMGRIRRDSNVWWNSAPHDLSVLHYLLDVPVIRVSATGHAFLQSRIEDVVWASLRLAGEISAHVYVNWLFPEKKASLVVVGERGMVEYEGRFDKRRLIRSEYCLRQLIKTSRVEAACANLIPIENTDVVEVIHGDRTEPLLLACAAFRDSIVSGEPAPSSGQSSLRTLAALEAGAHSLAQHGMWKDCAA